jgi:hypothetical protein
MTKALPCINTQQFAAKTISKDQQPLGSVDLSWLNFVQQKRMILITESNEYYPF